MSSRTNFMLGLVRLAVLSVSLRYIGEFSWRQSIVLALLCLGFLVVIHRVVTEVRARRDFEPYRVWVYPKWHELLADLGIIRTAIERKGRETVWLHIVHELEKQFGRLDSLPHSVFLNGFNFTVIGKPPLFAVPRGSKLRPDASIYDSLPGLTYWYDRKVFCTELDLSERILLPEGWYESEYFKHEFWGATPAFFFKAVENEYELGLEVRRDWWERLCAAREGGLPQAELLQIKTEDVRSYGESRSDRIRLVFATLPHTVFEDYYEKMNYDRAVKRADAKSKELEARGWMYKRNEYSRPGEHEIEHKYFSVGHLRV